MRRYFLVRIITLVPTLIGVTILVFLLVRLIPGTVVDQILGMETRAPEEVIRALRAYFGLDRPIYVQYWDWISRLLVGDLGTSFRTGRPVAALIGERLWVTVELTVGAMLVAMVSGLVLGTFSALRENTGLDHVIRVVSLFSLSIPIFWQAAMLVLLLSRGLGWAPPARYVDPITNPWANLGIMALPCVVLGTAVAAQVMRMSRSALLDVLRRDYIRAARAKGLSDRLVVWRHAMKNAMIPVVTVTGIQIGYLLGGAVVTEEVFALPGVGRLMLAAVYQRDYPLVQGVVLFLTATFMLCNLLVDVLYAYLDPRIRYE
jgi:peptide/nickel transport system permease protein